MDKIRLKDKEFELFIPEKEIKDAIAKMAKQIKADVGDTNPLFVGTGELSTHLVLSPGRAGIYDTLYGLCRSGRMQCGKYEMSGLGSEQCCGNCLVISHLSY